MTDPVDWIGWIAVVDTPAHLTADQCLVCGTAEDVREVEKTYEVAPITALARRAQTVGFSLCGRCDARWASSQKIYLAIIAIGLLVLPTGFGVLGNAMVDDYGIAAGATVGFLVWLLCVLVSRITLVLPRQVRVVKVDDKALSLRFPDPELARRLLGP